MKVQQPRIKYNSGVNIPVLIFLFHKYNTTFSTETPDMLVERLESSRPISNNVTIKIRILWGYLLFCTEG